MFDTKTNFLSFVDPKLWPFKKYWYPKITNFEMPITPPLGVLGPKNFGFPSFSPGGTSMPKMIKIGEIRVLIYFDLPWNEPKPMSDLHQYRLSHSLTWMMGFSHPLI